IGYHGRAGTVRVSGTDVVRPDGWRRDPSGEVGFGPCQRLDFEAEVGFVVGAPAAVPVALADFSDHVVGVVLLNDWSARGIHAFGSVPPGRFLGTPSPPSAWAWVLPFGPLDAARVPPPRRATRPGGPLDDSSVPPWGLALDLEVLVNGTVVSRPPFASMYWTA